MVQLYWYHSKAQQRALHVVSQLLSWRKRQRLCQVCTVARQSHNTSYGSCNIFHWSHNTFYLQVSQHVPLVTQHLSINKQSYVHFLNILTRNWSFLYEKQLKAIILFSDSVFKPSLNVSSLLCSKTGNAILFFRTTTGEIEFSVTDFKH